MRTPWRSLAFGKEGMGVPSRRTPARDRSIVQRGALVWWGPLDAVGFCRSGGVWRPVGAGAVRGAVGCGAVQWGPVVSGGSCGVQWGLVGAVEAPRKLTASSKPTNQPTKQTKQTKNQLGARFGGCGSVRYF